MQQFKAKIITNQKIAPEHYTLSFKTPLFEEAVKPGQFFNIRVNNSLEPLLRRPFSAHKIYKQRIEILYKVVGKATKILSTKKKGDILEIIGPLGNGFDVFRSRNGKLSVPGTEQAILVAGGHGAAPLVALARQLRARGVKFTAFIGARNKKHVVCDKELEKLGAKVYIATDDGSKGYRGLVANLLSRSLRAPRSGAKQSQKMRLLRSLRSLAMTRAGEVTIYACGPKPMLKEVAKSAKGHDMPCRVSLEEYMACGIGTCLGCAVKTRSGYKMVCKDGPVFDAKEIIWQN